MAGLAVVALEGSYLSSLGVFVDTFGLVRLQVASLFPDRTNLLADTPVHVLTLSGGPVRLAGGRELPSDGSIENGADYELVHIPAFVVGSDKALDQRLAGSDAFCVWLRRQHASGAVLSGSGAAVFLLARARLLDGGPTAVSASLVPLFRKRFPALTVERQKPVTEHERVLTGVGLAADNLLMSRLAERVTSPPIAHWLASVTGLHQTESDLLPEEDLVTHAKLWLEERFAQDVQVGELAAAMAVSPQTLLRHFKRALGKTPRDYLQQLRIEAAKRLLQRTRRPVAQIATLVGYTDLQAFRRVFMRHAGCSASEFRRQQASGRVAAPRASRD